MTTERSKHSATHIVLCVEATAAMAKFWNQDYNMYLDPLLKALEDGHLGNFRVAVVLYGAAVPYRYRSIASLD
jgi:hypothetical protein